VIPVLRPQPVAPGDAAPLARSLAEGALSVTSGFFPPETVALLRAECALLHAADALAEAGVGRGATRARLSDVRRDKTVWMDGSGDAQRLFLDEAELLRQGLNARLTLGLFRYEAHYAVYPQGAFYRRHTDSFQGARSRILSTVLYLNDGWSAEDGGFLTLFRGEEPFARVAPEAGTCVVFLSEDVPHEVEETRKERMSVAGWFHGR
jgi:SM-20-related protein